MLAEPANAGNVTPPTNWSLLLLFAGIYTALYLGYSAIPDEILSDSVYFHIIVRPAEALINWVDPAEHVRGVSNQLVSRAIRFNIVRGCDGAGFVFLLIAAVLACRARRRATVLGVAGAVALVYALNEVRIIVLYFVASREPAWFLTAHVYLIPTLMILMAVIYFSLWTTLLPHAAASSA